MAELDKINWQKRIDQIDLYIKMNKITSINAVVCAVRVRSKGGRREATRLPTAV